MRSRERRMVIAFQGMATEGCRILALSGHPSAQKQALA